MLARALPIGLATAWRHKARSAVMDLLIRFATCQSGATAIEYSLIAGLIGLAIVAAAQGTGNELKVPFQDAEAGLKQRN